MKATVVFDLDYTLMDTTALKDAMAASLADCGVAPELFWKTYEATSKTAEKICDYDPGRHADELAGRMTCSRADMLGRIDGVLGRARELLLPGATDVLRRLRDGGASLVLFTHGNAAWQERKTAAAGLSEEFDRLMFVPEEKGAYVEELKALQPPIVMINDNGREIDALRKALPTAAMIAVRGPKPLPSDPAVPVCDSLEQVYKEIMKAVR